MNVKAYVSEIWGLIVPPLKNGKDVVKFAAVTFILVLAFLFSVYTLRHAVPTITQAYMPEPLQAKAQSLLMILVYVIDPMSWLLCGIGFIYFIAAAKTEGREKAGHLTQATVLTLFSLSLFFASWQGSRFGIAEAVDEKRPVAKYRKLIEAKEAEKQKYVAKIEAEHQKQLNVVEVQLSAALPQSHMSYIEKCTDCRGGTKTNWQKYTLVKNAKKAVEKLKSERLAIMENRSRNLAEIRSRYDGEVTLLESKHDEVQAKNETRKSEAKTYANIASLIGYVMNVLLLVFFFGAYREKADALIGGTVKGESVTGGGIPIVPSVPLNVTAGGTVTVPPQKVIITDIKNKFFKKDGRSVPFEEKKSVPPNVTESVPPVPPSVTANVPPQKKTVPPVEKEDVKDIDLAKITAVLIRQQNPEAGYREISRMLEKQGYMNSKGKPVNHVQIKRWLESEKTD